MYMTPYLRSLYSKIKGSTPKWASGAKLHAKLLGEFCTKVLNGIRNGSWGGRYTGCNRRNGPDFGRVFLMLNYTEKPQNTYIQSSMVTEI